MSDDPQDAVNDRGELTIVLGGEPYGLRPSYEAIVAIEATTDRGLVDLARDALGGRLKLGLVAQVVCECIRAWGQAHDRRDATAFKPTRIGRLIVESPGGLLGVQKQISGMLSVAVTGGYDAEGNLKPVTTMTSEEAPVAG